MPVGSESDFDPVASLQTMAVGSGLFHFEPYFRTREPLGLDPMNSMKFRTIFQQHERFQIVSAGRDRLYGNGGIWPLRHYPSYLDTVVDVDAVTVRKRTYKDPRPGQWDDRDNISNFAKNRLDSGQ